MEMVVQVVVKLKQDFHVLENQVLVHFLVVMEVVMVVNIKYN
jgi:hypothetical protein